MATELLVGAYIRRSDNISYTVRRIDGTQTFVLYIDGARVGEFPSRRAAFKAAL